MERFERFNMFKCVYKPALVMNVAVTTHSDSTTTEKEKADSVMLACLKDGLDNLHDRGIPPYAITHFYVKCEGMDTDFMFNGTGPNRLTLKQLRKGKEKLQHIVTQFASIIQSGKDVSINDHTLFTFYAFIPPVEFR